MTMTTTDSERVRLFRRDGRPEALPPFVDVRIAFGDTTLIYRYIDIQLDIDGWISGMRKVDS